MARIIENPTELILTTAKSLARENGLASLSIRKVAGACGIAAGTIYNYYPSKAELLIALMEDFWNGVFQCLPEEVDQAQSLTGSVKALRKHLEHSLEHFRTDWLSQMGTLAHEDKITCHGKNQDYELTGTLMETLQLLMERHQPTLPLRYQANSERHKAAQFLHHTLMGTLQHQIDPDYFETVIDQLFSPL